MIKTLENQVNTVLDQSIIIKSLSTDIEMLTETVNHQNARIMEMQERITDLEATLKKQSEGITIYEHEKDGLNDTVI